MLPPVLPAHATPPVQLPPRHRGTFPKRKHESTSPSLHPSLSLQGAYHPQCTDPPASLSILISRFLDHLWGPCLHICHHSLPSLGIGHTSATYLAAFSQGLPSICPHPSSATPLQRSVASVAATTVIHGSHGARLRLSSPWAGNSPVPCSPLSPLCLAQASAHSRSHTWRERGQRWLL